MLIRTIKALSLTDTKLQKRLMFQTELHNDRMTDKTKTICPLKSTSDLGCKEMYSIKCTIFFVATNSMSSTFTKVALIQVKHGGEFELSLFKVCLISAVSSISVSVIIAFVVWQVRKSRLPNLSSSENACRWTNQSAFPADVENNATQSRSYSSDFLILMSHLFLRMQPNQILS